MSYKTILLCLTTQANARRLTHAGCLLAEKFDAHLIGLHALHGLPIHSGATLYVTQETIKAFDAEQRHQAEAIRVAFLSETGRYGRTGEWRSGSFRSGFG